jgi:hypothetical protein
VPDKNSLQFHALFHKAINRMKWRSFHVICASSPANEIRAVAELLDSLLLNRST